MSRYFLLGFVVLTLQCGSFGARLGIWPGDRVSGRAEAPPDSFWKFALVTTSHEKGYAGGHGGGTTFHTMTVKLSLYGGPGRNQEVILEKGTVPLTSESDYVYGLVSRNYDLRFSPDGTKLAITYDGKDFGYLALDANSKAFLFHRERRFHPQAGPDFWKVFPAMEDYAVELLAKLQFTKAETFREREASEEPPYFRTIDSASDDSVIDLTDRFLTEYASNDRIYLATLRGALEVSRQFPVSKARLDFLTKYFTTYAGARSLVKKYLSAQKLGPNSLSYAAMLLSTDPEEEDIPPLSAALARLTDEMQVSDNNYRVYHVWDYNRYLWAMAAIQQKLHSADAKLVNQLIRVLKHNNPDSEYDLHPARVYAIQALAYSPGKGRDLLRQLAKKDATTLPAIWPKKYGDAHRDYCLWEEKYSDCNRSSLAAWARAALARVN